MLCDRLFWRPAIVSLPFIGPRLESIGLIKFAVPDSFKIVVEPFFLQFTEPVTRVAAKGDSSDTVSFPASPLTMVPGSQYDVVPVKTIFLFHLSVHQLRPVQIFLVIITTNVQLRNFGRLHITKGRIFL